MKAKNLFLLTALLLFGIMVFSGCKKDNSDENSNNNPEIPNGNSDNPELYALDISQETDWDYMLASKEGSCLFFDIDKQTNIPTNLVVKPLKDSDYAFTVMFKSNGQPDYAIFGDTIVVFENFKDTKCDIAIIYPNISVKYFSNIETGVDWNNTLKSSELRSVSPETAIAITHSIKFIGAAIGAVGAGLALTGAIAAGGPVLIAVTAVGAAITAASIYNSYFGSNNTGIGLGCDAAGSIATTIGCVAVPSKCLSSLALKYSSFFVNVAGYALDNGLFISTVQADMRQNPDNPGNPNNPTENLVNKTLTLTLTSTMIGGSESYTCVLKNNSVVQVENGTGSWEQGGNSLRMNWTLNNEWHCTYSLTGTLSGNSYSGTYTHIDYGTTLYDKGTFTGTMQ